MKFLNWVQTSFNKGEFPGFVAYVFLVLVYALLMVFGLVYKYYYLMLFYPTTMIAYVVWAYKKDTE